MTHLPRKIKQVITQTCIDVERAYSITDVANLLILKASFSSYGNYEYPEWLELMINWKREDPILSTEETFRKKYWRKHDNDFVTDAFLGSRHLKPYSTDEMLLIWKVTQEVFDGFNDEAFRQALWGIAAQMLGRGISKENGLEDEWHRKVCNETRWLDNRDNYINFKHILLRESQFWERAPFGHSNPTGSKTKPSHMKQL